MRGVSRARKDASFLLSNDLVTRIVLLSPGYYMFFSYRVNKRNQQPDWQRPDSSVCVCSSKGNVFWQNQLCTFGYKPNSKCFLKFFSRGEGWLAVRTARPSGTHCTPPRRPAPGLVLMQALVQTGVNSTPF